MPPAPITLFHCPAILVSPSIGRGAAAEAGKAMHPAVSGRVDGRLLGPGSDVTTRRQNNVGARGHT